MPPKKRGSRASTASKKREESSVLAQAAETTDAVDEPVPSPATELIQEAAAPLVQQQQAEESDDIVTNPSPLPISAVVVAATPNTATPTSSNPQVPRDASLRSHHPTVSGVSAPLPSPSSTRTIVTSLDAFLSSPECSGQLIGAWNRMGYCAATQAAILNNMSDSVIAHVSDLVTQQVDTERAEAAKVEMLFDECLLLSQRLQEQVVTASLNEIYHSIISSSSASPRTTSAAESEELNKKKKLVRLVGGVSSDENFHGTSSTKNNNNDDANVEIVTAQMPSFACGGNNGALGNNSSNAGCPSAMLSPKQAHASRPTSGDTLPPASISSSPSYAFLQLPHSKQIEILGNERRRFSRLAEERVEYLRLIYCSKRLLDVPVRRQEKLRAGYAKALFDHSVGEDLRAQSSNSSMFFTPTGSPRVTINQVALTTPAVEHHNDIFHQQHIPEVVTAAVRAVSRLRSLSVTARAYPFDHPLCATTPEEHSNSQPATDNDAAPFILNDKHCQAILAKGARQDLSMDRVGSEANAVMRTLTKYIRSMMDAMHTESTAIETLEKELGSAAPKTERGNKVKAAIKEAMETFGAVAGNGSAEVGEDGIVTIYDQQFDNSVLYHQFPECVARLYTIRLPAHALLEASAERERLQMIHYDSTFMKFAEAQHEVWGAYKLYFSATGDQSYASPPDYSDVLNNKGTTAAPNTSAIAEAADTEEQEWLERGTAHFGSCKSSDDPETPIDFNSTLGGDRPANKASSPVSTPKTLSQQAQLEFETHRSSIARLVEATSKYADALSTVAARMAVLKEIEPLLKRRDYIIHAQSNMQAGSKERLLSRSVNMAKQLREEESLRKMIQKEIPSITAQVVALCDSWETLTRTRMIINNKDVLRVVSGMTNDSTAAAHGGGSTSDCNLSRVPQYIYGVEAAAAIGAASTTPGSRLGSPVPGGVKRDAASRSPAPQLPRRQMSSQIPSPSPQPKDRAATPIAVRNMSRVGTNTAPSVSPRPRSVTPAKSPQAARVTLPPVSNGNSTVTRSSRVAISTPTSTEARAPNQLSRGTSSAAAVSRSLAQPPSRALSRSKAVSPATTRAPPTTPGSTHPMQRGTATNPVQHPARSRSPQPKGSAFTRPPPMNTRASPTTATSASPRAGGTPSSARVPPGSKRSRSLTPTATRDGMAPSPLHPSSSAQPRSAAMSRSRQPLQDRQDANSQPTASMPSTNNKNPSVPATASSPMSVASPSAYVPSVFALPTTTTPANAAEE